MRRVPAIFLVSALISGCFGISVTQDYDTSVDFSRFKTYAWESQTPRKNGSDLGDSSLVEMRIRAAVDSGLSAKGYRKVDPPQADYFVTYHYGIQRITESDYPRTGVGVGVGSGSRGRYGGISVGLGVGDQNYEQDTLTLDVIDPKSGKLVWRGFARQRLERDSDPEKITARFNATVAAILAKFPPETKR